MLSNLKDRLIRTRLKKDERFTVTGFLIIGLVVIILVINIIYLNIIFLDSKKNLDSLNAPITPTVSISQEITPTGDLDQITITPSAQRTNPQNQSSTQGQLAKDYFIPLGSGTSQAGDWEDVPGVLAMVDFGQYQNIKEIRFEASVVVPTGNEMVWVRLFNKTDKHPVWYSEVSMESNATSYLISSPVVYDFGLKQYQVQMKTQLKSPANLVQSRIHVILN